MGRPHAQLDVAQRLTGIAAQTTCTVLPLLLTVLLLQCARSSPRWLQTSNADLMRPHAQLDVAQRLTGTAALTTCTVLPLLLTVLLLLLAQSSPRWLPTNNAVLMRPHAQLDVAQRLTGIAAQTTCTVLPLLLTVLLLQ